MGMMAEMLLLQTMTQHELLDRLESELREVLEIVRSQIGELPLPALQNRPEKGRWNALESLAHLNVFLEMYLPRLERAIHLSKARRWTPVEHLQYNWIGRKINRIADIGNFKAHKTPKRYDTFDRYLGKEAVKTFLINTERLLRNLQAAREVDLNRAKIPWGPSGFFKPTLGNTLEWMVIHGKRHVLQAVNAVHAVSKPVAETLAG